MKRTFSIIIVLCLILSTMSLPVFAASNSTCYHPEYTIRKNIKSADCFYITYNCLKICNDCGELLETFTEEVENLTPTHEYTWKTVSCNGTTHIYEYKCTECGFVQQSLSRRCTGDCVDFNSIYTTRSFTCLPN